ncbi:MAG TPA: glycosyltransferase family 4 protein [Thermoanaerobaculia bacterium]|jgi:glycosyltransferase involved in cell wall biosynthesis
MTTRVSFLNPFGYAVFDESAPPQPRTFGGAEVQMYYLARELAKDLEFDVTMVVESADGRILPEISGVKMVPVRPMAKPLVVARNYLPFLSPRYLNAMRRADADVYVQRGAAILTGETALFCRTLRRGFVFMAAHDWDCDRHHERRGQYVSGRFYELGLRLADVICAQSTYQHDLFREHYGIESVVLRSMYPPASHSGDERSSVLWIGRCLEWKRPMAFLDLARRVPDHAFTMVCPAYPELPELYRRVEAQAAALPNVTFHPFIPFAETAALFASARLFVNTSVAEGMPNTFVQAARAGTPVVSLAVDPDRLLEHAGYGLGANGSFERLYENTLRLLTDEEVWRRCSANARAYFARAHEIGSQLAMFKGAVVDAANRRRSFLSRSGCGKTEME